LDRKFKIIYKKQGGRRRLVKGAKRLWGHVNPCGKMISAREG
jgi:hypothetical protein